MEWTKIIPTEPGWYWVSYPSPVPESTYRHRMILYLDENQTYYSPVDWDDERRQHISELGNHIQYMGPIPVPDNPEG